MFSSDLLSKDAEWFSRSGRLFHQKRFRLKRRL